MSEAALSISKAMIIWIQFDKCRIVRICVKFVMVTVEEAFTNKAMKEIGFGFSKVDYDMSLKND